MGMKKNNITESVFWKFLCMLLIGLIGAVAIPFSLILAGTSTGLITYADYSERRTKDLAPVIALQRRIWQMCDFLWGANT